MGKSSKPLVIHIAKELYDTNTEQWNILRDQGFDIQIIGEHIIDLYFAPYAMRMTSDMMINLPTAIDLAIKGARALRYAPHGTMLKEGSKHVKAKKPCKGKNSAITVEVGIDRDSQIEGQDTGIGGSSINTISAATNNERIM